MHHQPHTVFRNVNVIPMDREGIIAEQSVIVRGSKIAWIGPVAKAPAGRDAVRIDGKGRYLMPGLVDMHVHVEGEYQFPLWLANGVTTVRNMWGSPEILNMRRKIDSGKLLGPALFTSGPILNRAGTRCTAVETPGRAREVVAEIKKDGYDFVKVYDGISREVYNALIKAAKQHNIPVIGHVPIEVGIEHALASRHHCIEHLTGYDLFLESDGSPLNGNAGNPARFQMWRYADLSRMPRIVEATREAGSWNAVSLTVFKNKLTREAMERELKRPCMSYVPQRVKDGWFTKHGWVSRMSESASRDVMAGGVSRRRLIRSLKDAGAGIVLGTDDPDPLLVSGVCVHEELQNLVEAGLTPYEAVRAGTSDAADCLGAADQFGMLTVGQRADLLMVEESPLADVANAAKIAGVMVRGRWLPQAELQVMLNTLTKQHVPDETRDDPQGSVSLRRSDHFHLKPAAPASDMPKGKRRSSSGMPD